MKRLRCKVLAKTCISGPKGTTFDSAYFLLRLLTQGTDESLLGDVKGRCESFRRLTERSRNTILDGLRKSELMVRLCPGTPSSRMFATTNQKTFVVEPKKHNAFASVWYLFKRFQNRCCCSSTTTEWRDLLLCRTFRERYSHQSSHRAFGFIYQIPDDTTRPTTLLSLIATTRQSPSKPGGIEPIPPKHALEQRFELARKITSAVMYVHVSDAVRAQIYSKIQDRHAGEGRFISSRDRIVPESPWRAFFVWL
jgi:hypothetical protein